MQASIIKLLTVQIKESTSLFSTPVYLPPGQKKSGVSGHNNKEERILLGNIRSEEKRRVRFNRKHANDLFLKFSLHDKLLAETVHTVDTEKIVAEKLAERFPDTSEVVFQSQILNHEYGEVLVGALQ